MKKVPFNTLGITAVLFNAPETVAEFDKNAKRDGACLDEATRNIIYRGSLTEFRDMFLHGLSAKDITSEMTAAGYKPVVGIEEVTKIDRKTVPVMKDGKQVVRDGQPVEAYDPKDSEDVYFKRVLASTGKKADDFFPLAQQIASMIPFDASARERKPKAPAKLAQKHKDTANQLYTTYKKNLPRFIADYEKALNTKLVLDKDATKAVEQLGWAIQAFDKWDAEQQAKARQNRVLNG
jgi:hypothetical protein